MAQVTARWNLKWPGALLSASHALPDRPSQPPFDQTELSPTTGDEVPGRRRLAQGQDEFTAAPALRGPSLSPKSLLNP